MARQLPAEVATALAHHPHRHHPLDPNVAAQAPAGLVESFATPRGMVLHKLSDAGWAEACKLAAAGQEHAADK